MDRGDESKGGGFFEFWKTLPGFITAGATLLSALVAAGFIASQGTPEKYPPAPGPVVTGDPSIVVEGPTARVVPPAPITPAPITPRPEPPDLATGATLVVGIRPELGQISESMELTMDGRSVASWTASEADASKSFVLKDLTAGSHTWTLSGEYSWFDGYTGEIQSAPVANTGTIQIWDGIRLGILYYLGQFSLTAY